MRNFIVYFGIIFLPDKNALCQRANSILKSAEQMGYETIVIGMSKELNPGSIRKKVVNKRECYEISYPSNGAAWLKNMFSTKDILTVLNDIGKENIRSLIVADYRFFPMLSLKKYCEQNGINYVVDIMDWFLPERRLLSWLKQLDNWMRLNILYPRVERKICICDNFAKKYRKTKYLVVIPGTIDPSEDKWKNLEYEPEGENITLVFAGQPGKKCKKERIDWVIRAIYECSDYEKIHLCLCGVAEKVFRKENPHLEKYIDACKLSFLGRIPHQLCISQIASADFSLVIRKKNKLSEYGFATKISEAFACGTPILATNTSDVKKYVVNRYNGLVCEASYEGVCSMIQDVLRMDKKEIIRMHEITKENNCLIFSAYTELLRKVL